MLTSCRFIPAGNNNDINDTFFLLLVVGTSSTKYTNSLDVVYGVPSVSKLTFNMYLDFY